MRTGMETVRMGILIRTANRIPMDILTRMYMATLTAIVMGTATVIAQPR
uniref:Type I secretion system ATPase, PrtD n=1 Tax=Rubinisphaera brasiliensis (strain ATCC 49424 / DSM 5305 / JCM 21570 / IAM 15109 / NBRC 103401 / IFAM 1448) TaxID=756272 RepID=F0SHE2_RUBBR|nr:type I secretion system ATPase, PrtD [Rubinisphaera brasiliensis DSM 5305]